MALTLSHSKGTRLNSKPESLKEAIIQSSCEQQEAAATYLASMLDWSMLDCFREDQETMEEPKN